MQEEEQEEEQEEVQEEEQEEVQHEEGSYCLSAKGKGHKLFTNAKKYDGSMVIPYFWICNIVFCG